ncbi:MAG TPA: hypothetical protein EYO84_09095, partial [Planctomycetes bacterium]|nr:hypothetical protein [Planctomycetota bacterium]
MRPRYRVHSLALLLLLSTLLPMVSISAADDSPGQAIYVQDGVTISDYVCSPDCGPLGVDEADWFAINLTDGDHLEVVAENLDDPASVRLHFRHYLPGDAAANASAINHITIESNAREHLLIDVNMTGTHHFEMSTEDGWSEDGSNYNLTFRLHHDNSPEGAREIEVGTLLKEEMVCQPDCDTLQIVDEEDWFRFNVTAGDAIGIIAERISWYSILDFELFEELPNGSIAPFNYSYHGGSSGGPDDYISRGWFNASSDGVVFVRVYASDSSGEDLVEYNLSVISGEWVDVIEDDYHWISYTNFRIGDKLHLQAIRTDTPNDLDILLYNDTAFQNYRQRIIEGNSSVAQPEELMAVEDCLVCSFTFELTTAHAGSTDVQPSLTTDPYQPVSWTPTLHFVADYTDYMQNPPQNSDVDIAHVFLSVSVERGDLTEHQYTLWRDDAGAWMQVDQGLSSQSSIQPPSGGWSTDSSGEVDAYSFSRYHVVAHNDSGNGTQVTDSYFEVRNHRPVPCATKGQLLDGVAIAGIPFTLDASCSSDPDNNNLTFEWRIGEALVGTTTNIALTHQVQGTLEIELVATDDYGLS